MNNRNVVQSLFVYRFVPSTSTLLLIIFTFVRCSCRFRFFVVTEGPDLNFVTDLVQAGSRARAVPGYDAVGACSAMRCDAMLQYERTYQDMT